MTSATNKKTVFFVFSCKFAIVQWFYKEGLLVQKGDMDFAQSSESNFKNPVR